MGVKLRAVLARLHGKCEQYESDTVCQQIRRHLWLMGCQSLRDYLVNPIVAGCEDKGVQIFENIYGT
eukprot:10009593-Karenia_brevis.AAC.1